MTKQNELYKNSDRIKKQFTKGEISIDEFIKTYTKVRL